MSKLWVEWEDDDGNEGAARWGTPLTDDQVDAVIASAEAIIGRAPDTIA